MKASRNTHTRVCVCVCVCVYLYIYGLDGKESACNVRNLDLFSGLGRPPGVGHGNPLQDSCLKNPMDRGPWWATVHGVAKSWIQLSD